MAQTKDTTAPIKLKLLITVVNRNKSEYYSDLIAHYDTNLQMSFLALGTAHEETLRFLGIKDNEKAVLMSVIRDDREKQILSMLSEKFRTVRNGKGIAFTVPMTGTIGVGVYRFLCNQR